jgi:hypothetical protein
MAISGTISEEADPPRDSKPLKSYTVLLAEDVPHYGTTDIEAVDDEDAVRDAKALDISGICVEPSWDSPVCQRIIHIGDSKGNVIARDLPLDDYVLSRRPDPAMLAESDYSIGVNNDGDDHDIAILRNGKPIATLIATEAEIHPLLHAGNCFTELVTALEAMLRCFASDSVAIPEESAEALRIARETIQKATGGTHA